MKIMIFEDGRGDKNVNQWLMSNMQVSMQEIVKRDYKLSVSLSSLDSIYRTGLAAEGLDAEVITCVTDSLGNILRSSRSIQVGDYGLLKPGYNLSIINVRRIFRLLLLILIGLFPADDLAPHCYCLDDGNDRLLSCLSDSYYCSSE